MNGEHSCSHKRKDSSHKLKASSHSHKDSSHNHKLKVCLRKLQVHRQPSRAGCQTPTKLLRARTYVRTAAAEIQSTLICRLLLRKRSPRRNLSLILQTNMHKWDVQKERILCLRLRIPSREVLTLCLVHKPTSDPHQF